MVKRSFSRFFLSMVLMANFSVPSYAFNDLYHQINSVNAGIYLRIPFGATKKNQDGLKYGLRLNMTREFSNNLQWNTGGTLDYRQMFNADLLSLNFSESGFRDMSFAGNEALIYRNGAVKFAVDDDQKDGTHPVIWMFAGVGTAVLALVAVSAVVTDDRNNQSD